MQALECKFGNLTLKNSWVMSAKELGFLDANEWAAFYLERAKFGVSGIVFPVSEVQKQEPSVVKQCLRGLDELQCISFLQIQLGVLDLQAKLEFALEMGFLGVVLEISSQIEAKDISLLQEVFATYNQKCSIFIGVSDLNDKNYELITSIKGEIHGVCILNCPEENDLEELIQCKKNLSISMMIMMGNIKMESIEKCLQNQEFDAILTWKPLVCDTKFVDKLERDMPPIPCQECGVCTLELPVTCPYHPEVGSEYFETQRRKIATRKEVCIYGNGISAGYAAKKALERGFPTTICKTKDLETFVPQSDALHQYQIALYDELDALGVKFEEIEGGLSGFLRERKPYFTLFFQKNQEDSLVMETMFDLLDERLSCAKFLEGQTKTEIEESLVDVYQFFKQFYLA
ncbi:hypothetical protein [Chakrabartyella piscis]|uniref:hypothetical protein n=1 Tax=Chakrabartyella piscis TaxID=2918914 RepID=UPI0029588A45|nr:hypothetical protein [Chakrabartyella piscis]